MPLASGAFGVACSGGMLREMTQRLHSSQRVERVILTGFMGCGKTTVGRVLAERLGWTFADLDDAVAGSVGLSVPEIFAQQGEAAFRRAEVEALASLLTGAEVVIALGGGAPETPAVRTLLQQDAGACVIHLDLPFPSLYRRCTEQAEDPHAVQRPLLGSYHLVAERHERRRPFYEAVAHHRVAGDRGTANEIADAIRDLLLL